MTSAVALVQAYLRVNGYFTVSEFPVIAASREGGYRAATELDIFAVRFAGAGRLVPRADRPAQSEEDQFAIDEALHVAADEPDMIIGEVKEGHAVLNAAASDPSVLRAVLIRFGCCAPDEASSVVERLIAHGDVRLPGGHRLRRIAFGSVIELGAGGAYERISLGHIVTFLQKDLRTHWAVLRHEDSKDPAMGLLTTIEKALRGAA